MITATRRLRWVTTLLWAWTFACGLTAAGRPANGATPAIASFNGDAMPAVHAQPRIVAGATLHRAASSDTPFAAPRAPFAQAEAATDSATRAAALDVITPRPRRLVFPYEATAPPASL